MKKKKKKISSKRSENSDDSDCLPHAIRVPRPDLVGSDYLKLYKMQNPMHDRDREQASSLALNIKYNKTVARTNPYFNKVSKDDKDLNVRGADLLSMS